MDNYGIAALSAALLVCAFALWKGGRIEQAAAIITFIIQVGMSLAQQDTASLAPKHVFITLDVALMIGFAVLAWKSTRSWPLFALAFQMIKMTAHVAFLLDLRVATFAYLSALNLSDYGVLATLAVGTWHAWREREALSFLSAGTGKPQ